MRSVPFYVLSCALLAGCPSARCPAGDVPVEGACYPADAVAEVDGAVPLFCTPECTGDLHCDHATGECVACAVDAHCSAPAAPACDATTRTCTECTTDADCAHFADAPYCDGVRGTCAACTPENEATVCGDHVCDVTTGRCTTLERASRGPCEPCHADSECGAAQRCVAFAWYGHADERVCLYDQADVVCATSADSPIAPYVVPAAATTLRGESVHVCQPPSSCGALRDYAAQKPCVFASDCAGPPSASQCPGADSGRPGVCTMWCATLGSGYSGCSGSDICTGLYCAPP